MSLRESQEGLKCVWEEGLPRQQAACLVNVNVGLPGLCRSVSWWSGGGSRGQAEPPSPALSQEPREPCRRDFKLALTRTPGNL